ncbi:DoxX family protein [Arachidicoccus sp.]|uniref:DoxX family protein n=1 Tax=Arachidicoccus sp. TaxID=1872624 RepID=UPI003D2146B6
MKKHKIIYWVTTSIIFLFDAVLPALTFNTPLAKEGIHHLGYPDHFRIELTVFKVIGGIILILPMIKPRYKEWAYAGFGISMIAACVANWSVDGLNGNAIFPLVIFGILIISYVYYHKTKCILIKEKNF